MGMKNLPLSRALKQVILPIFNIIIIHEFVTIFSITLASVSAKMRPVTTAKKARVTQEECEDFDIDTHQASQSEDSSDEDMLKDAFTKVPPLKKKGKKAKQGIYMNYNILIHIKI